MSHQQVPTPAQMYHHYFGPAIFAPWAEVLLEQAVPRQGERVLDLACGTGIVARAAAERAGVDGRVVAVDISTDMVAVARAVPAPPGASIDWREGNAVELALPDSSFDLVLCQQGLQFFSDRAAAVGEIARVLDQGGRAVLATWQGLDRHPVYEALIEAEARHLGVPVEDAAAPFSLGDAGTLHALFAGAGFEQVEVVEATREVHFPEPERFVHLALLAAAAVMPEFDPQDEQARTALFDAVTRDVEHVLHRYRRGDRLSFPMTAHLTRATR